MRHAAAPETRAVSVFMLLSAGSVAGLWTADLVKGDKVERPAGVLSLRDRETQQSLLPHLIAEYATAGALVAGAVGLTRDAAWARTTAVASLGALTYSSINSLSWVVTRRERLPYGVPMVATLVGSVASLVVLLKRERSPAGSPPGSPRGDR